MFKITIVAIMLLTASTALVIYKRQQELNTPVIVLMGDDYKAVCRQIYNSEIDHKIHTTFKSFDECNTSKKKDFMQYEFNRQIEENLREQKKQHIVLKAPEAKVSATQNACEKLWSDDGKAYYYCPKNMTPEELGVNIKQFAENNYSKSRGMALIHIFNNKKLAPTSDGSFKYVPDKVLDKILVGMFTYIQDNHYMEFNCMRAGATDLSDCTNLVPKTEFVIPN